MPRIVFRGKTYYSVYEMPPNIRRAYEKEQKKVSFSETKEKTEPANDSLPIPFPGIFKIVPACVKAAVQNDPFSDRVIPHGSRAALRRGSIQV